MGEHPERAHSPPPSIGEVGQSGKENERKKKKNQSFKQDNDKDYKENPVSTTIQREGPKPRVRPP
jgi:hypothetical protein